MAGAGRKITLDDVEERLVLWIHERRSRMLRVSHKMIMLKGKSFFDENNACPEAREAFVPSRGWLEKFMGRNNLLLRQRTTTEQKDPFS